MVVLYNSCEHVKILVSEYIECCYIYVSPTEGMNHHILFEYTQYIIVSDYLGYLVSAQDMALDSWNAF